MATETTERDLVVEVEALLAKVEKWPDSEDDVDFEIVRRLAEEVKALRAHVADLNHDMEASNRHCEEYHYERPVE